MITGRTADSVADAHQAFGDVTAQQGNLGVGHTQHDMSGIEHVPIDGGNAAIDHYRRGDKRMGFFTARGRSLAAARRST